MKALHRTTWIAVVVAVVVATACKAPPSRTCNDHFVQGAVPEIKSESLAKKTALLCYEEFAVMHSGISGTPLWAAEYLTRQQVQDAIAMKRKNAFHAEERLPKTDRAELEDYVRSGYDRGHMAPSGDMPNEKAQYESFSLANMIPQNPNNNQNLWAAIEKAMRDYTTQEGQLYTVTGPIFEGSSLQRLNGRVLVPTFVYKAIYNPARNEAGAYLAANAPGMEYQTLSIAQLEERTKVNLFPKLPPEVKARKMQLPAPIPYSARTKNRPVEVEELSSR